MLRSFVGEFAPQAMVHDTINPFGWRWVRGFSSQEQSYIASKMPLVLIHWFLITPIPIYIAVKLGPTPQAAMIYIGYFIVAVWVCFSVVLNWQREHYGKPKLRVTKKKKSKEKQSSGGKS